MYSFVSLFEKSTELGDGILSKPTTYLPLCDRALIAAQKVLINSNYGQGNDFLRLKQNIHARITGLLQIFFASACLPILIILYIFTISAALPVCPELYKSAFPRNEDVNCFLRITGTVVKRTSPKMLEYKKDYICAKCKQSFSVFVGILSILKLIHFKSEK